MDQDDSVTVMLRQAVRASDAELDTAEVRAAISPLFADVRSAASAKRRLLPLVAAVAAAALIGIIGWNVATSHRTGPGETPDSNIGVLLVAAKFDDAAAHFPLPAGATYNALRTEVLAQTAAGIALTPTEPASRNDAETAALEELVARYAECQWHVAGDPITSQELTPEELERARRLRADALIRVRTVIEDPSRAPSQAIQNLLDGFCEEAE